MPAASAISCNDVRNPEDAINDAPVCRISVRRLPESSAPVDSELCAAVRRVLGNASALAMAMGTQVRRNAALQTCAYVLPPNQIFVRGYQTGRKQMRCIQPCQPPF